MKLEFGYQEKELKEYLVDYFQENHMSESQKALEFADEKHRSQIRKEGIPYIVHPLMMAYHALSVGVTDDVVIAIILLHDVCEDCPVVPEELPVSEKVRTGVRYMTYVREPGESGRSAKDRYYSQMRNCREACLVKLFDRCNNVSTMSRVFSEKKLQSYIEETRQYVYPLLDEVRRMYPEHKNAVFLLEYHMKSVIESIDRCIGNAEEKRADR